MATCKFEFWNKNSKFLVWYTLTSIIACYETKANVEVNTNFETTPEKRALFEKYEGVHLPHSNIQQYSKQQNCLDTTTVSVLNQLFTLDIGECLPILSARCSNSHVR